MKINEGLYFCEWCGKEFKQLVGKYISPDKFSKGKSNVSSQCTCPYCNRGISQKTKWEVDK